MGVGATYGTVKGLTQGHISPTDFIVGILGNKVLSSPAVKTRLANKLGSLSPEESTILSKSVPLLKNIILELNKGH